MPGTVTDLGTYSFTRTTTVTSDATLSGVADSLNDYKRVTVVVDRQRTHAVGPPHRHGRQVKEDRPCGIDAA